MASLTRLFAVIRGDVWKAREAIQSADSPFARRQYIRALTAMIEGAAFALKHIAALSAHSEGLELSVAERAILAESNYDLDERGRPVVRPLYPQLGRHLRFVLELVSRTMAPGFRPAFGPPAWPAFLATVRLRNRLTHPKNVEDLTVTDNDLGGAFAAENWFLGVVQDVTLQASARYELKANSLRQEADALNRRAADLREGGNGE